MDSSNSNNLQHRVNSMSIINEQPIKPTVLQQLAGSQQLEAVCLDQSAPTHPQLSSLLKSSESTNALVHGGIGTFTNLMDYQKASLATGGTGSPNSTSCTSGLADLSWASNDSAVCLKIIIFRS